MKKATVVAFIGLVFLGSAAHGALLPKDWPNFGRDLANTRCNPQETLQPPLRFHAAAWTGVNFHNL